MAVRLRDVAERAGVSVRTASNVVNDFPHVKPSTRLRVQSAIDELGYRPNLSARQLKYGRSGFIALAIPQIDSPYFAELAQKFTEAAAERGFIALMDVTNGRPELEKQVMSGVQSHMVDGVVFSPLSVKAKDFLARKDTTPMVLLGERAVPEGYDHVAVDSIVASRAMVEHLLGLGRRRIAVIGYEAFDGTASVRLQGYRDALSAAGLPLEDELMVGVPAYLRAEGQAAMQRLLALPSPPDAVFCFNDLMAIGALSACRQAGVRVPEDVAVAGFDGIAEGVFSDPPLTTIQPDLGALTTQALRLLLGRIDGSLTSPAEDYKVPWKLVVRASTVR
ncbi:LacI family DNA-binding transcriptional regulator [Luteococcus sp. H138]|uniref:LacI family DNA-binding transcriptional regulator n=1 Tax=unclassified Luteococcus TaxID=2639923 RepID=UPI00313F2853